MKRKKLYSVFTALFLLFSFTTGAFGVRAEDDMSDDTLAPYFFIDGGKTMADSFPLKETQVTANINGTIADIYVVQTYTNDGNTPINASYVFPASTRASVHGMKMQIGDKVVTAVINEREEAKQKFEEAKEEGKSASLLEQQRPNVFSMNIANIMPEDVVRIELHYSELIIPTESTYEFVFPTVVGPRYSNQSKALASESDKWVESPYLKDGKTPPGKYDIKVNLSTGVPISELECKSHKVAISQDDKSTAEVTLVNPEEYSGNRDFILEYRLTGKEIQSGLMLYEAEKENFFMLMVQPPERVETEDIPPREYIFVLDVSGSMHGYPLDTAKALIRNLVKNLRQTDKFNLILFAGSSDIMSSSSVAATEENIRAAVDIIDQQRGSGGTELSPALEKAVSIPSAEGFSRNVIIITDGYIDSEKAIFELINKNLKKTNFFSFGIGSSVNRYLIEGIAKAGLGEPFVITDSSDATKIAELFREYIQSPVLTDIDVKFNGFNAYDIEPPNLPGLFAQRPIILFGKWKGEPSGLIRLSGKTGSGDYVQDIQVSDSLALESNSAISYLWARSRISRLSDYGTSRDNTEVKDEITRLGLDYSMMTPYTSFIAIIDEVRNTGEKSTDVDQPLPLPLNVSNLAIGGGYSQGSEPEIIILFAGIAAILLFTFIKRRALERY